MPVRFPEVTANFFVSYKEDKINLYGWIKLDESFNEFLKLMQEEIVYDWGAEEGTLKITICIIST